MYAVDVHLTVSTTQERSVRQTGTTRVLYSNRCWPLHSDVARTLRYAEPESQYCPGERLEASQAMLDAGKLLSKVGATPVLN